MKIYIPSTHRSNDVSAGTLKWIPDGWYQGTCLVVHDSEQQTYRSKTNALIAATPVYGIDKVRHWIGSHAKLSSPNGKFLMLDDDLCFAVRKSTEATSLRPCNEIDMVNLLLTIEDLLDHYAHVSVSMRFGNQNHPPGPSPLVAECGRGIRAMAFRVNEFLDVEHGRVPVMEDFDVTLQLLRRGYKNAVIHHWAQDQKQTNAPGGCSTYRSQELQKTSAEKLASLHPGLVDLRWKENKTGGEFGRRQEVTIRWKKALGHDT